MTVKSHITGKKINRFTHIHQSVDDLVKKEQDGRRLLGSLTACCFWRCVGMDALNALSITTHAIDAKCGTEYNKRLGGRRTACACRSGRAGGSLCCDGKSLRTVWFSTASRR